jgi:malate dehydrogenase (oxaloacetate-decarboxylating)(NADP+)
VLTQVYAQVKDNPKRVIFAEAEDEVILRAAIQFRDFGYGTPVLVGRTPAVKHKLSELGVGNPDSFEIHNAADRRMWRRWSRCSTTACKGAVIMERDVRRMVNHDRNAFAAALLKLGVGDAMVTGITRPYAQTMRDVRHVLDAAPGRMPFGIHVLVAKDKTVFLADTTCHERPSAEELAVIAKETARFARSLGHEPRVAFVSYSTFGNPTGKWLEPIRGAISILDQDKQTFEYEGEMAPDAALNPAVMKRYPFSRLTAPANVLVFPGLQSANIAAKLLKELGGNATIGPVLVGMEKPVQIVPMTAIAPDVLTLALLAASESGLRKKDGARAIALFFDYAAPHALRRKRYQTSWP